MNKDTMNKILEEFFVPAPWGKIATVTWGNPKGDPILLVHGGEDSAATFIPLLELLPKKYYYVAIDLPGHGKSDPFPISVIILRLHFVIALEVVVKHMQWKQFTLLSHSMGAEIGMFYNAAHPGQIKKFIQLDPGLSLQVFFVESYEQYMMFHGLYYMNYDKYNHDERIYGKRRALDAVMKARGLTEEQAEIILSRNLTRIGEDRYKLSWDKRLKFPIPFNLPIDFYLTLFSKDTPPTLVLAAKTSKAFTPESKAGSDKLLADLASNVSNFHVIIVDGNHDVHLIHPDRVVNYICRFLETDYSNAKSKL